MIISRHEQGQKPADIARSLNLPTSTIRSLIHRTYGNHILGALLITM